jgi:hypothetical protein
MTAPRSVCRNTKKALAERGPSIHDGQRLIRDMLEDDLPHLIEDVGGQKAPMLYRTAGLPGLFRPPDVMTGPEEPVYLGRDDPGALVVQPHPPFDRQRDFDRVLGRRVGDRDDIGHHALRQMRGFVGKHDGAWPIFKSFDLLPLGLPIPEVGIADDEAGVREFRKLPACHHFLSQRPMPRRSSDTFSSLESHLYSSGISLFTIASATAASSSATGTTSR